MDHAWKKHLAAVLAALSIANCAAPAAFAQDEDALPQTVQAADSSAETETDFLIENGTLTSYTGSLTDVVIPEGVLVIGDGSSPVFGAKVESVTIPASAATIAENAFSGCAGLKNVTFASGSQLQTIEGSAFYAANQLETLTIPEGVTTIGTYAFAAMRKLQSITLPGTLTTVCDGAWFGNLFARGASGGAPESLTAVHIAGSGEQYCSYDGAVYSADGQTLLYVPAAKKSIDWPESVTAIGTYALCRSTMSSITLPETIEEIADGAFNRAELTSLELPASVHTIGTSAFFFSKLSNLVLNEGLSRIEENAFSQSHVSQVTIPASVEFIGENAFDFEYGSDYYIRLLGKDTTLADEFIPYYYPITVYGLSGSTAEAYVAAKNAEKGDRCKLTFETDGILEATDIQLAPASAELRRTETLQLTATVLPAGAQGTVSWSSSAPEVASVSGSGLVTAAQQGQAVITASIGKLTASCTVRVVVAEDESDYLMSDSGEITAYLGADWETLTIPAEINGKAVTGIASGVFQGQTEIRHVVLPQTVQTIADHAFSGCTGLLDIDLRHVTSLGTGAFQHCSSLQAVVLGEGLTAVPEEAFANCSALRSVTLPASVKELGRNSFSLCGALETLELPEGLTTIHAGALKKCPLQALHLPASLARMGDDYMGDVFEDAGELPADTGLKNITVAQDNPLYCSQDGLLYNKEGTVLLFCPRGRKEASIPEGVTEIGRYAFFMCFDLTSVALPSTLKTVNEQAFHYCEALTQCELPDGLERVEDSAFFGCESWAGVDRIPSSVQYIGPYAFTECKGTKIVVPDGIVTLPKYAFWGYEETLTEITLPTSLKTIGDCAFAWAKNVQTLTIPEGVVSVGAESFARMDALRALTLPGTLRSIGATAFAGGDNVENHLEEVYIPASVTEIGENAFAKRPGLTIIADSEDSAAARYARENGLTLRVKGGSETDADFEIVDGVLIAYHGAKSEVVIPSSVTEIGPGVFEAPEEGEEGVDITKVTIPASVTKIGDRAFYGCQLTEVTFAEGSALRQLGESAFAYCTKLPEILLPEGLEVIGVRAFDGDSRLSEIAIPGSVTTIGAYAFALCSGLKAVQFASGLESQLKTIGDFAFYQCYRLTQLDIPEGVVSIGNSALRINRGLARVSLPSTLEQLGTEAPLVFAPVHESSTLSGSDDLVSITVADGNPNYSSHDGLLYTADGKTLLYCPAGRTGTVDVADGTQTIASYAFHRSQASHVSLPDGLKTIADNGFVKSGLVSVELPQSVESIGKSAFFNCSALKTAQLGSGLKTIGESAFSLTRIAQITIPAGVASIGKNAFDFEYGGSDLFVRVLGESTVFEDEFIPYYYAITVYGSAGSTAEAYVANKKLEKGSSCKLVFQPEEAYTAVTAVTIEPSALTLKPRETASLRASVLPANATHTDLVFKSLDTAVATVDASGLITALTPGAATIRVLSSDGPYADCAVTVAADGTISSFTVDSRGFITGYTGESADLVVPDTVDGTPVLGIAAAAFQNRWDIDTVTLPDTVQEIEESAFSHCGNLSAITFGAGLRAIGSRAFENCTHLRTLSLPEGLETLGEYAFDSCESLETLTLPSTLRQLPKGAFYICWRLKEVNIPEGVVSIGQDAFYECEGMTSVTLPTSLRTISSGAFAACVRLSELTIPEGVETIEKHAFMSCTALTAIHLPSTLQTLGEQYPGDAFERSDVLGCNHLTAVTVAEGNPYFSAQDGLLYSADGKTLLFCPRGLTSAAVREGTQRLGDYALFYCRILEHLTLPATLREIGSNSLSVCEQLRSLELPKGLVTIEDAAFANSAALTELTIPGTVKTIGARAFLGTALESLSLPASVMSLGEEALAYNQALRSVTIRSTLTGIGADLFKNSPNVTVWTDAASAPIYAYAKENGIPVRLLKSGSGSGSSGSSSGSAASSVSVPAVKNGTVTVTPRNASKGETVTITVKPDSGYVLDSIAVKDASGSSVRLTDKGNGKYTFLMPSGRAEVSVRFTKETSDPFADVSADAYYYDAVKWASGAGITDGIGDHLFAPDRPCTRAQIVTFLWRAAGKPIVDASVHFSDVPADAYYAEAVRWAVSSGVTTGTSDTTFQPDSICTRAQSVTFLYRALGKPSGGKAAFRDVSSDSYYAAAVAWATESGVTNGISSDLFAPDAGCTRGQIVTFLYRAYLGK